MSQIRQSFQLPKHRISFIRDPRMRLRNLMDKVHHTATNSLQSPDKYLMGHLDMRHGYILSVSSGALPQSNRSKAEST